MANFGTAYSITHKYEKGFVNDPEDKGGMTYHGISRRFHPNWYGWVMIDAGEVDTPELLQMHADFFRGDYWNPLGLDAFVNQVLANLVYDTSVLFGLRRSGEFLQRALNALNANGSLWPDLEVDGIVGEKTIATANACTGRAEFLVFLIASMRASHHLSVVETQKSQERFMFGWVRRAKELANGAS